MRSTLRVVGSSMPCDGLVRSSTGEPDNRVTRIGPSVTTDDIDPGMQRSFLVTAYPFALVAIAITLNLFVFGLQPVDVTLPSVGYLLSIAVSAALLVINHTWLMISTELTRVKLGMSATPEEWAASGRSRVDTPALAAEELERRHNAHRNTTENVVYFALLVPPFVLVSPPIPAVQLWMIGFGVARLGYTYSYLSGRTGPRGLFMSLGLLSLYGMSSYALMSLLN